MNGKASAPRQVVTVTEVAVAGLGDMPLPPHEIHITFIEEKSGETTHQFRMSPDVFYRMQTQAESLLGQHAIERGEILRRLDRIEQLLTNRT